MRVISGLLLISMGCYLSNWWRGLLLLERLGQHLWRHVQPLTAQLLPVRHGHQAVLVGLCWGLLPCGLIYTALAWSASTGNGLHAALQMFCFGMGTVPVMFASGHAGEQLGRLLRRRGLRSSVALLLAAFGLWTIFVALQPPHGHQHSASETTPPAHHASGDHG